MLIIRLNTISERWEGTLEEDPEGVPFRQPKGNAPGAECMPPVMLEER